MELQGKKVLVVGMAKTGVATARFLLARGARVTISEVQPRELLAAGSDELAARGVCIEAGGHRLDTFAAADCIVVSPGVPLDIPPLQKAGSSGIEIISEIELAYRFLQTPLIAVTGTNGKTTTTMLLGEIFKAAGKRVFVGGNIGTPLIEYVSGAQESDYVIAEISSFQLEGIKTFRPCISVLLNLTEDHLDRYRSFVEYIDAKNRLFMNQQPSDKAVLNFDDPVIQKLAPGIRAETVFFSSATSLASGISYNGDLCIRYGRTDEHLSLAGARLQGAHNIENMLAAVAAGVLCNLPLPAIQQTLVTFSSLEHRMEFVDEVQGVRFCNDSKGTNVGAVVKSIESLDPPLILIAGGKDKGGSYQPLRGPITQKVKVLVLFGEARQRMFEELRGTVETFITSTLEDAMQVAFSKAQQGDTILFSPACSSFDMFTSYAHRGQCFKDLVKKAQE